MARSSSRRRGKAPEARRLHPAAAAGLLLVAGVGLGGLLGLDARGAIGDGWGLVFGPPPAPKVGPAPDPAAGSVVRPTSPGACMGDCVDRELGYSFAAAAGIEDLDGCNALAEALRPGCADFVRAREAGR